MNVSYNPSFRSIAALLAVLKGNWQTNLTYDESYKVIRIQTANRLELTFDRSALIRQIETLGFEGVSIEILDNGDLGITATEVPAEYR